MSFFAVQNEELEQCLKDHFQALAEDLRTHLDGNVTCLALGGGYGRGEGGVIFNQDGEPHCFNDLDYFLFCQQPEAAEVQSWIKAAEAKWSEFLCVDVEFKALTDSFLHSCNTNMMAHDLVLGHHLVYGPSDYIERHKTRIQAGGLPLSEMTRLLWNRGCGLYFARCRVEGEEEAEFVLRNHQKAKLALGDALLGLSSEYHASARERGQRVQQSNQPYVDAEIKALHAEGVRFKLEPWACTQSFEALREENHQLTRLWARVFLHIESVRLSGHFQNLAAYVNFTGKIDRETPAWKPPLLAFRDYKKYGRYTRPIRQYPRATLYQALACLNDVDQPESTIRHLPHFLGTPADGTERSQATSWEAVFTDWWSRYS